MAIEQWTDERLNQVVLNMSGCAARSAAQPDSKTLTSKALPIQETAAMTRANAQITAENSRAIADLRVLVTDLRERQAMLAQMVVEEREARPGFRRTTKAALDRIDRTLEELRRGREDSSN